MRHTQVLIIFFLSSVLSIQAKAQIQGTKQIPFINSKEIMEKGIKEHDDGHYKKAISCYEQVPEGDTNYLWALYESSLSNLRDSNYAQCVALSKKTIALNYAQKRLTMLNMGAALDEMGKPEEAVKIYDSVAKLYPYDNRPYYERAVIKYKAKDYVAAEKLLQQSLMLNPLHFRSHFMLGSVYAFEGRLAESIMALNASLLCSSDYQDAKNPISILDAVSNQTDEIAEMYNNRKTDGRDPAFDEIDEIVHAKLALDKGYKLKSELDDNIFRQLQVVMEKLQYDSKDSNFAMQYYVPIYTKLYKEDQFEPFVLLLFSGYGIKSIDKVNGSHRGKAQLEDIKNVAYPYLTNIFETRVLNYTDRKRAPLKYHNVKDEDAMIVGIFSDIEAHKLAQGRMEYYQGQALVAEGNYDANGKKNGVWKYYYPTGIMNMKEEYKDGKSVSDATEWYDNGVVKKQVKFNNDGTDTETKEYTRNGILESVAALKAKDEYEYTYYYPSGVLIKKITYVNDKVKDGKIITYFENGKKQREFTYKNENADGPYVSYFDNGQIDETFNYQNQQITGAYKSYYRNGTLAAESAFIDGKKQGESISYRRDGSIESKIMYNKGKADGDASLYNKNGKIYGTVTYRNNRVVHSRFFMPDGTEINDKEANDEGYVNIYNEYGVLIKKLEIDKEARLQGKATYYYDWGGLKEETHYLDDNKNGKSVVYYENGSVNTSRKYRNDTADGYYQSMNELGKLKTEGWLKDDISQGIWHNYNMDGTLSRDFYMVNDEFNGPEKNYDGNGKLSFVNHYDEGMIVGLTQYDTSGKVLQDVTFEKGNGKYKMLHLNGTTAMECDLKYGKLNGHYANYGSNKDLLEKGSYSDGKLDGESVTYFPNGILKAKGLYKNGQKDQTWKFYAADGMIESITQYKEGNMEGKDSTFSSGRLNCVANYVNDEADGLTVSYGENGKISGVLYFDAGTPIGYSYEGKDGKLLPMKPIEKATAHIQTYYADGSKALDWNYDKNLMMGKQVSYYDNGQMEQEIEYEKGFRTGIFNQFNPDGSKFYEGNYKNGVKHGICKTYNNKGKQISVVNFTDGEINGDASYTDEQGKTQHYWYYHDSME